VLVPLPGAPSDHQTKNAQALARVGAAVVVRDRDCDASALARAITTIVEPAVRTKMGEAARALGRLDAGAVIARVVLETGGPS